MAAWQEIAFASILCLAVLGASLRKFLTPDLYYLAAACLMGLLGIVPAKEIYKCIANGAVITVISLWLIAQAMEEAGLFRRIANKIPLKTISLAGLGAFLNHTFLLLNTIPYLSKPHRLLLPISFALLLGGACTLIGTPVALFVNQLLIWQCPDCHFAFFELGKIGLPSLFIGLLYLFLMTPLLNSGSRIEFNAEAVVPVGSTLVGKRLYNAEVQPKGKLREGSVVHFLDKAPREEDQDLLFFRKKSHPSSFSKKEKKVTAVLLLIICALIFGVPLPFAAAAAAFLLFVLRCLSSKAFAKAMRWDLLILIISSGILMTAFNQMPFPHLIAQKIVSITDGNLPFLIAVFFLSAVILDFFIPSIVTVGLLFPIAVLTSQLAGWSSINGIAAVLVLSAVVCQLRPRNAQTHAIVMQYAGYRELDYWKIGLPLVVILLFLSVWLAPRFWSFL